MNRAPGSGVNTETVSPGLELDGHVSTIKRGVGTPLLRFPSCSERGGGNIVPKDTEYVPEISSIAERYKHWKSSDLPILYSEKFRTALKGIQQLLIFDIYFDEAELKFLRDMLVPFPHNLSRVFVLTGHDFENTARPIFDEIRKARIDSRGPRNIDFRILCALRSGHKPYPHDRFAVLDGAVWHFGATVGGIHSNLNAFSYGWADEKVRFSAFFKKAWDHLTDEARKPDK